MVRANRRERWLTWGVLGGLILANLVIFSAFHPFYLPPPTGGDASIYYQMSSRLGYDVTNPYIFRLMSPWLVSTGNHLFGWGQTFGWGLLTVLSLTGAQLIFFRLLRKVIGLPYFSSVVMTLFLMVTMYYTQYNYQNIWMVDPLNSLFTVVALWFLLERRYTWFLITITFGTFNKESVLLLAPLYWISEVVESGSWKSSRAWRALGIVTALFVLYIWFRSWLLGAYELHHPLNPLMGVKLTLLDNLKSTASLRDLYKDWFLFLDSSGLPSATAGTVLGAAFTA